VRAGDGPTLRVAGEHPLNRLDRPERDGHDRAERRGDGDERMRASVPPRALAQLAGHDVQLTRWRPGTQPVA
jgi:hypothetical protein